MADKARGGGGAASRGGGDGLDGRIVESCPAGMPQTVQLAHMALLADHADVVTALERRYPVRSGGGIDPATRIAVHIVLWSCKISVVMLAIVIGYLIKSGLAVDLIAGPSPLHFIAEAVLGL